MAWYPGAQKLELQPESDAQPAIIPTQFLLHSIAAPWTPQRTYEYWRDSTNLESHFGLGYDGSLAQFIGTQTRADANYRANLRPDGTGAVSLESASNDEHTDPWTEAQVEAIIRLGLWLHQQHGIPLRVCRSASDPGYGYHRLFPDWSTGGTACPGDARVAQFKNVIFPAIVAHANGAPTTTTPTEEDDLSTTLPQERSDSWNSMIWGLKNTTEQTLALVKAQGATIDTLAKLIAADQDLDAAAVGAAVKKAVAEALAAGTVDVDVTVHDKTPTQGA